MTVFAKNNRQFMNLGEVRTKPTFQHKFKVITYQLKKSLPKTLKSLKNSPKRKRKNFLPKIEKS